MGLEEEGLQVWELATSLVPIPKRMGKWNHGLTKEELKVVEDYYGHSFDNPDHDSFWNNQMFQIKHTRMVLRPDNPEDILKAGIIKTMGLAATSMQEVENNPMARYTFVIEDAAAEQEMATSLYEMQDECIVELNKLRNTPNSERYLFALAVHLFPQGMVGSISDIKASTKLVYTRLREFIDGNHTETQKDGPTKFLAALDIDKGRMLVKCDVTEAIRHGVIRKDRTKNQYYNSMSQTVYGKSVDQVVDFLLQQDQEEELGIGSNPPSWSIRTQLRNV